MTIHPEIQKAIESIKPESAIDIVRAAAHFGAFTIEDGSVVMTPQQLTAFCASLARSLRASIK